MVMVSRDAVEAFGDDGIASNIEAAVGTGGMQHLSREADVQTELERNPNYFRNPLPYFDGLRADWNAWDPAYRAAQYVAGASDFLFTPWLGYPAENEAVRAQVGEENMVEVPINASWNNATYFHTQVEPYTDPRVRRALHLATNREQLFAVAQGFLEIGGPICHAAGVYAWSVDELRQLPGYRSGALREEDLAEGRRLLDASGYDPESVPPMSTGAFYTDRAEVIQQNFAEIGFEVDLEEFPDNEQDSRRTSGNFSIHVHGLGGAFDPDALHGTHHTDGGRNWGEFSDPEIDALLEQGRTTIGTENRVRDLRRDPGQAARRAQSPDLLVLGPAGRRPPSLAQGLRSDQQQHRRHPGAVPVVVRGQARRVGGKLTPCVGTSPPNPLSIAEQWRGGTGGGKGGSRTAPTRSRSLSIALRWRGGTWPRRRPGAPRGRPDSAREGARQGDHKGRPDYRERGGAAPARRERR